MVNNDRWGHRREGTFTRPDRISLTLDQSVGVWHSGLCREVVHFIIQQKSKAVGGDSRSEPVIDGRSYGNRLALGVNHRVVGGVISLVGRRRRNQGSILLQFAEHRWPSQLFAGRRMFWID